MISMKELFRILVSNDIIIYWIFNKMTDNKSIFTAELMHSEGGNGAFRLFFAQQTSALLEQAAQLTDVGKLFVFTTGDTAGNFLIELNPTGVHNPECLKAARNPLNFQTILMEFAGNISVNTTTIRARNMINGSFTQAE